MKKKWLFGFGLVSSLVLGSAMTNKQVVYADKKIDVVTTFYPVYEFTKHVVGKEGDVNLLIKAGTEVHDFQPSTKDIAKIQDADAFVYGDDSMETWVPKVKKSINQKETVVVKATGDMILAPGNHDEHDHDHEKEEEEHVHAYDPHVWLSPERAKLLVKQIRDDLSKAFPDKADEFSENANQYLEKLDELNKEYSSALSTAKQKSFVTQHAAFGYLALDYGLNQVAITGVSAESEPSAKRLASLSKYIKDYDIKYIYFEENASKKVAETLAKSAGVKTAVLNPLESLTAKQMKAGEDYFSVMRQNLKNLQLTTNQEGKDIAPEKDESKTVSQGYFETKDVKDRTLADWTGSWQSVYPYLEDGTLDPVWDYKAKSKKDMSAEDYKAYYTKGYQTDVNEINIDGKKKTMTFVQNGQKHTYTYDYAGKEILTYKKGNRGVRYLFETKDGDAGQFKYVQFSDHGIMPQKAEHFHIFFGGESQAKLLEEMENWPTYYASDLTGKEIAQEIVVH